MNPLSIALLCLAAALAAGGQVLLKRGADGRQHWTDFLNLELGCGLALYAAGTVLWIGALSREPLVKAYAFTALSFVLVYGASVFILKERLTVIGGVGVLCVLVGLYLIAFRSA
jgi:drug/metabolite transporter (DMT)-like permease